MAAKIFARDGALRIIKRSLVATLLGVTADCVCLVNDATMHIRASHCDAVIIVCTWMKNIWQKLKKIMAIVRHIHLAFIFNYLFLFFLCSFYYWQLLCAQFFFVSYIIIYKLFNYFPLFTLIQSPFFCDLWLWLHCFDKTLSLWIIYITPYAQWLLVLYDVSIICLFVCYYYSIYIILCPVLFILSPSLYWQSVMS